MSGTERGRLLDLIVKALEPYDIQTGSWTGSWTARKPSPANAVLDAITPALAAALAEHEGACRNCGGSGFYHPDPEQQAPLRPCPPCQGTGLAGGAGEGAEHEGCRTEAQVRRIEVAARADERQAVVAELAALRTEREELAGLLYDAIVSPSDDPLVFGVELDHDTGTAHLARTDTGGQE